MKLKYVLTAIVLTVALVSVANAGTQIRTLQPNTIIKFHDRVPSCTDLNEAMNFRRIFNNEGEVAARWYLENRSPDADEMLGCSLVEPSQEYLVVRRYDPSPGWSVHYFCVINYTLGNQRIAGPGETNSPPPLTSKEANDLHNKYCKWIELDD